MSLLEHETKNSYSDAVCTRERKNVLGETTTVSGFTYCLLILNGLLIVGRHHAILIAWLVHRPHYRQLRRLHILSRGGVYISRRRIPMSRRRVITRLAHSNRIGILPVRCGLEGRTGGLFRRILVQVHPTLLILHPFTKIISSPFLNQLV